ncbi:MAG: PEP-CTERM sorting domain-containing protein [Tepidisphaeraceae bacterium]
MTRTSVASMRLHACLTLLCWLVVPAQPVCGIGWAPTDFLIGGGTAAFTNRIGVFDSNLSFKGYLDSDFFGVGGMDFDANGHLVAVSGTTLREVRVYDSSGAKIGGFIRPDNAIDASGDLVVAPGGDYVIGQANQFGADGARRFHPDGTFVQQYGTGDARATAFVPGDKVWTGRIGLSGFNVFDFNSGVQTATYTITGMGSSFSMNYSAASNTVLSISQGKVWEIDAGGNLIRTFLGATDTLSAVTRGPGGDVFATSFNAHGVFRWNQDGTFVGFLSTPQFGGTSHIGWAGNVPEPSSGMLLLGAALAAGSRAGRRRGPS